MYLSIILFDVMVRWPSIENSSAFIYVSMSYRMHRVQLQMPMQDWHSQVRDCLC
jgi:hypothetical protein